MVSNLDILAFAAHPDDVEISAGGSILKSVQQGNQVGIIDLTAGELGSRGNAEIRASESGRATKLMGIHVRKNLGLRDGFFEYNETSLLCIIQCIREFRPRTVLCTAPSDRHPDHGRAAKLILDACFYAGLQKIETTLNNANQETWRPKAIYHYIQDQYLKPDFVMDVTPFWEKKIEVLKCYSSQFYDPESKEPGTPISGQEFFDFLKGRAMQFGRPAGFLYAEGFIAARTPGIEGFAQLI